jgi:hypothetical protein
MFPSGLIFLSPPPRGGTLTNIEGFCKVRGVPQEGYRPLRACVIWDQAQVMKLPHELYSTELGDRADEDIIRPLRPLRPLSPPDLFGG